MWGSKRFTQIVKFSSEKANQCVNITTWQESKIDVSLETSFSRSRGELRNGKQWHFIFSVLQGRQRIYQKFHFQGDHKPGKPGKLREFVKLLKSQGKLREILIFV